METARRATLVLLLALAGALPLGAQQLPPPPADGARAQLEAGARWTSLRSETSFLVGGSALLDLGIPFRFGAAGWILPDPLELPSGDPGSGLRLKLAYGGLQTAWVTPGPGSVRISANLLLGAGSAKLELPVVGTEIAADNFLAVEPGLSVTIPLAGPLHGRAALDYRFISGLEDLPGIATAQIRGLSATLGLAIGPL